MGREVRMVPPDWQHPQKPDGGYLALHDGFAEDVSRWDEECAKWDRGEFPDYAEQESRKLTYAQWNGERPQQEDYMPDFVPGSATHYMMYETCTEGTPISPAFATPEELAHWLADNGASAFAGMTASYEAWLGTILEGSCHSCSITSNGLVSGVEDR